MIINFFINMRQVHYSKYITLTSNNLKALTKESNGFKVDETGTNYVTASVDRITNNLGKAKSTINEVNYYKKSRKLNN